MQTTLNWFTSLAPEYDEPCIIDLCDELSQFRKHMYNDTIHGCVYLRKPSDFPWSQVTVLFSWSE